MNLESYILRELRIYMKREGITEVFLAESCDYPQNEVKGYLTGRYRMPLEFIIVVCHFMGSSVDEMECSYQKLPRVMLSRMIMN